MTPHDLDPRDRLLDDLLHEVARRDRQDRPSARVEHAVMAHWADAAAQWADAAGGEVSMPSVWRAAGLAFAVSAAAAWAVVTLIEPPRPTPAPVRAAPASPSRGPSPQVPAPGRPLDAGRDEVLAAQTEAAPAAARPTPRSTPQPDQEVVTAPPDDTRAFVALSPVAAQDLGSVRVMRVRLPGAAVRTLGLAAPAPTVSQDGFVQADVLLGEDGMARAIRLLP